MGSESNENSFELIFLGSLLSLSRALPKRPLHAFRAQYGLQFLINKSLKAPSIPMHRPLFTTSDNSPTCKDDNSTKVSAKFLPTATVTPIR